MRNPRGQTLLLFALTLLLLVLMVCMTLSIGMKAREKMELQTVADTAAFSNAVATARTFNTIAFMNRAQIGHMVSMAGVQSLISWTGYYRGAVNGAWLSSIILFGEWAGHAASCCNPWSGCIQYCACSITGMIGIYQNMVNPLSRERSRISRIWDSLDQQAGQQARNLQEAAGRLHEFGELLAYGKLRLYTIQNQQLAERIADRASRGDLWPSEWETPSGGDDVSMREIDTPPLGHGPFVVAPIRGAAVWAAMGSRGHPFVTGRALGTTFINSKLAQVVRPRNGSVIATDLGSGYFADGMVHARITVNGEMSWADDHGAVISTFDPNRRNSCPWNRTMGLPDNGDVRSTYEQDMTDKHKWFMGGDPDASETHTMGPSYVPPRGIWPRFIDYNFLKVADGGDIYGQPKNMVVLQRNYGARPRMQADPWNLMFRFRFTPGGQTFDNNGVVLANGTDISRQTAISTGVAYYHRRDHWSEPPNLFNPFWRAGLVHADVDDARGHAVGDVNDITGNVRWAGDAYQALVNSGFRGIQ